MRIWVVVLVAVCLGIGAGLGTMLVERSIHSELSCHRMFARGRSEPESVGVTLPSRFRKSNL